MIPISQPVLGSDEFDQVHECLLANQLTQGPKVAQFELQFAKRLQIDHAVAVTSGTTALHLALAAYDIGPGDEVLVPDLTFVATANAVAYTGATPVLVDVNPRSWCIDLSKACVTPRTRAIIPVHVYGVPCDMYRIREFATVHNLIVIEDAAEGLGGSIDGKALGTFGEAGCFSFYGNKVLTTGEGGAIVTNDKEKARHMMHLRNGAHTSCRYYHDALGFNYRMTDLQAAIGLGQLSRFNEALRQRQTIMATYYARLWRHYETPQSNLAGAHQAPWLFTLRFQCQALRDRVVQRLTGAGYETRPTFIPLHRMPMYAQRDTDFPVATQVGLSGLSLPTFPGLSLDHVNRICDLVLA